jgi:signal transduction histidine kinase
MNSGSLRLRLFAAAAVSIAAALSLTGFAIVNLFERQVRERVGNELDNDLLQLAGAIELKADGTVLVGRRLADPRFEEPYGGRYWRIDFAELGQGPTHQPLQSRSLWDADLDLANPVGPEGETLMVASRQISLPFQDGEIKLRLTVATLEDEVKRPMGELRDQLLLSLTLIGLALAAGAWIQVKVGLSPLDVLRRTLAEVRAGRALRLSGDFPPEVAPLVGEFNDVLDLRDKSLERARRRAGDLAHGLKTPLTVLSTIARELRRHRLATQADDIDEQAETMRRHVERALTRARLSTGRSHAVTELRPAVEKVVAAMQRLPQGDELDWELRISASAAVPVEAGDLTELLGNLLDNARQWARARVRLRYDAPFLTIEDDGPGVGEDDLGSIAEGGRKLDESKQGSGLGLSIVADIADLYRLAVAYDRSDLGGLKVTIRL